MTNNLRFVLASSLLCLFVPASLYLGITLQKEKITENPSGALALTPGKLIITDKKLFSENPRNLALEAAETLNGYLCTMSIISPHDIASLKGASTQDISEIIHLNTGEPIKKILDNIQKFSLKWNPTLGKRGGFTPPNSRPKYDNRADIPLFGKVVLDNPQKERAGVESYLNRRLAAYKASQPTAPIDNSLGIAQLIALDPNAHSLNIPSMLAICQLLNIKYQRNYKLFLSDETLPEVDKWRAWNQ